MKIFVIGAGVIGVTTAWSLAKAGHQITILEERSELAAVSSHANGGQLSYDFASPMASPEMLNKIPGLLLNRDLAFRIKHPFSLQFLRWSQHFIQQCLPANYRVSNSKLKDLAKQSGLVLEEIVATTNIEFGHRRAGKLVIYTKLKEFERTKAMLNKSPANGQMILEADACLEKEPALQQCGLPVIGGVLAADDAVGDAALFTQCLADDAQKQLDVSIKLETQVRDLVIEDKKVRALKTNNGEFNNPDLVVFCTGESTALLRKYGVPLKIFPVRGYSQTFEPGTEVPQVAITDHAKKVVYSRIGDKVRVAGFADFGYFSEEHDTKRLALLTKQAKAMFPTIANYDSKPVSWSGNRPATPDNLPIVGPTSIENLHLNMGHGMFGWTLAAITAQQLAEQIKAYA